MYTLKEIRELADVKGGKRLPKDENFLDIISQHPYIRARDIRDGKINTDNLVYISEKTYEKIKRYIVRENDVCITIAGNIGDVGIIPGILDKANLTENAVKLVNLKGCDAKYLKYSLMHPDVQSQMKLLAGGAAQPKLGIYKVQSLQIPSPSIPKQKKIATILSAYDDLIDNNTRRIQILEEMARLIYREWFVHYRFPGHEDVKMVDSGTEFGEIPEAWEIKTFEDVLDSLESGSRPKGGIDPTEADIPSIGAENIIGLGQYDFSKEKFVSHAFFEGMNRGIVKSGDVLLYKDGAKIGRKSLFRDGFPHEICGINEHVFILRTNERITQSYLYFWLDLDNITQRIINLNTNAAQPGINQAKVKSLPILVPTQETIIDFEMTVEPMLALLFNLAKKNESLKQIRDLLLPKLISGEIDVFDLDIKIA